VVAHGLVAKAAGTVLTGLVGVSAYEVLRKAVGTAPVHRAAVTATEWGLRGTRRAEVAAEAARLKVADVVAEARERVGDETSLPVDTQVDDDCC
jgi:L-alanine-DL-glutamate epimerase-like enolase superfamily enzyme